MAKIAVTNVAVFDGLELQEPTTIVFHSGTISSSKDTESAIIVDGTGCTLLPGFIDCHVHVDGEEDLREFSAHGVTSVADMANFKPDMQTLRAHADEPTSGLPSYKSAGICAVHPLSAHRKMLSFLPDQLLVPDATAASSFVRGRLEAGSDYLKIIADVPGFDEATLSALVLAAREQHVPSIAHAPTQATYDLAARAGVHMITHIPLDGIISEETIALLKTNGCICIPTLGMMSDSVGRLSQMPGGKAVSLDNALQNLKKVHAAGIPLCAGSDSNNLPHIGRPYGSTLHQELLLMASAGVSNKEVLRSATSDAAHYFGFSNRGRVEPGFRADLVLVEGNPLDDISATSQLKKIWIQGVEVEVKS